MNKELLKLIQPELAEEQVRKLCQDKKEELGFDIEKAMFPLNPFSIEPTITTEEAIKLVEKWDSLRDSVGDSVRGSVWASVWASVGDSVRGSVWDSVGGSVWDSVGDSVRGSVWDSVGDSVRASVGDSVWDSLRGSVWDSVRDSVWDSVWASVWDSVWAYISSIFYNIEDWQHIEHEKGVNPFQPAIDLWEAGYVSSLDGKVWRLHTKDGIVWEGEIK